MSVNWKELYTKIFLAALDKSTNELSVKQHLSIWWQNTRVKETGGLRLTEQGLDVLSEIELRTYNIPYPPGMATTTQIIIFLDHFIECPYYLTSKGVIVTNERKAVELTLFSGDIRKYGMIKAMSQSKKEK
jgi:hypothetical protein